MSIRKYLTKALFLLSILAAGGAFAQSAVLQTAATQTTSPLQNLDELGLIAEQFLIEKTQNVAGKAEIVISPLDNRLKLAACTKPIPYLSQGARAWGKTTVAIRCEAPEAWRIMVKAQVKIHASYLVANKVLPQGHVIQESDLALATGDITVMRAGVLTSKEHAVGRTVARPVQPGIAIWAEQLRAPQAVRQGQAVRIVSQGRGFSVSSEGQAINNACEGQVAKAKMPNGAIIRGIAKADGIIEINF